MKRISLLFLMMGLMLVSFTGYGIDDARLLRFPDINGDLVTFVYAGDIWTANTNGGDAKRLTSHLGLEIFPKISPNGEWIAFSGEYSGNRQIYVIPSKGGTPKQLTYYNDVGAMPPRGGFDNLVLDWTSDSKNILIRSNRSPFGERNGKYYLVNIDGGYEKELPIIDGGIGVLSPDDKKLCFTPVSREFRSWKRYKGGRASDLWIFDLENTTAEKITDFVGTDQIPTWFGDNIFYASDQDLTLNIYSYNVSTKETKQLTEFTDFDVMWPSGSNGQLVFEKGGFLYKMDLESGETTKISINIHFDNPNTLAYFKEVKKDINTYNISPTGKRALFDARGDIFTVPAKDGITENLTQTQGIRERAPVWSPDGKNIAYISDATGEYEFYLLENKKNAIPKQLTFNSSAWKYEAVWSPNSKYLLYSDRTMQLKLINVELGTETVIDNATMSEIEDYSFAPNSEWLTYSNQSENDNSAIWVYNIADNKKSQVTNDNFSDTEPVFSNDGNYIFFLSDRDFNLVFSSFEFNYLYNKSTRIYSIALNNKVPKLVEEKNDVETIDEEAKAEETSKKSKEKDKSDTSNAIITIDLDGINNRIMSIPVPSGDYWNLSAIKGGIAYCTEEGVSQYKFEDEESKQILKDVMNYTISANGEMIMYYSRPNYGIAKLAPSIDASSGTINLDDMIMKIDPKKEWNQIYTDGWRIFRDYFYVDNMHGVDWKGVKTKYEPLLPFVSHRADLDYIFHEIISESNTGHSYVNYGDFAKPKRMETGLLGAKLEADVAANRYKIVKIYQGENWNKSRRSPLTEQGINVKEGDYLISINGNDLTLADNPYLYLENTVGKLTEIEVNSSASKDGAKSYLIKPIKSELELFYFDWVQSRRKMVDELSDGKIGYIHVPNTAFEGNRELFRGMNSFNNKEALIIDDRYNGGGFIPAHMANLLDRKTLSYWHKNGLQPGKSPDIAHNGPKAMLINGYSSSGGDAFPYYFKKKGLGKLIGTRTWGGLVGISGNAGLVDGGYIAVPRFGVFDENSEWIVEGVGVYPDIEVVDAPDKIAKGIDPSIEEAVKVLLEELEKNPVKKIVPPANPDRSKWIEEDVK